MLLVYCRSGRRSKEALEKLAALGYTYVYEFGGIIIWTGEIISTADEMFIEDDPFEAHEYVSSEDFYEDYGDNFDDFEEAEEYFVSPRIHSKGVSFDAWCAVEKRSLLGKLARIG